MKQKVTLDLLSIAIIAAFLYCFFPEETIYGIVAGAVAFIIFYLIGCILEKKK
jgi:hypothetical protein